IPAGMAKGCLKRMISGIAHRFFCRISAKSVIAGGIESSKQPCVCKLSNARITGSENARGQNEISAVFVIWATTCGAWSEVWIELVAGVRILHIEQEKTKVLVVRVVIHVNDELVRHRCHITQAEHRICAQLPFYGEIEV